MTSIDFTADSSKDSLGSAGMAGLKVLLLEATNGLCAICSKTLVIGGKATDLDAFNVCHVIPASRFVYKRAGYVSGNVFAGCRDCNNKTGDIDLTAAIPVLFDIPAGVIVWDWPTAQRIGRAIAKEKKAAIVPDNAVDAKWEAIYALCK